MGTRSLTVFQDGQGKEIAVMYRQYDGYIKYGHGEELVDFLKERKIVNGIRSGDKNNFNGMECLAASVIAHFKNGVGYFYLYPAGTRDLWEEYVYFVSGKEGDSQATIKVSAYGKKPKTILKPLTKEPNAIKN